MGTFYIENWPSAAHDPRRSAPKGIRGACRRRPGRQRTSIRDRPRARLGIGLKPGQRLGFHAHVLDYFWTAVTGGHGRSHFGDGEVSDTAYKPGDIKQLAFKEGEFMIHDLKNVGDTELLFTTVEFLDSPNAPLKLRSHTRSAAEV